MHSLCTLRPIFLLVVVLHSLAAASAAATNFFSASDPGFSAVGRTLLNPDGSQSFDWEGTAPQDFIVIILSIL
jgi:hypothetical protein